MAGNIGSGKAAPSDLRRCPLCGSDVAAARQAAAGRAAALAGPPGDAAALNRHFGTDCTWRHTGRSPMGKTGGR